MSWKFKRLNGNGQTVYGAIDWTERRGRAGGRQENSNSSEVRADKRISNGFYLSECLSRPSVRLLLNLACGIDSTRWCEWWCCLLTVPTLCPLFPPPLLSFSISIPFSLALYVFVSSITSSTCVGGFWACCNLKMWSRRLFFFQIGVSWTFFCLSLLFSIYDRWCLGRYVFAY